MTKPLRVLLVEDSEDDAALTVRALRRAFDLSYMRVDTAEAMQRALGTEVWDIVLSDHKMPGFDSFGALRLLRESALDLPFIIVSGTIGEDVAVAAMKAGAHDYLLKGHLQRLVPAIERELKDAEARRVARVAQEALIRLSQVVEQTADTIYITDLDGHIQYVNAAFERLTGYSRQEVMGNTPRVLDSGRHDEAFFQEMWRTILSGNTFKGIIANRKKSGELYLSEETITPLKDTRGKLAHFASTGKDITERERMLDDLRESEQRFRGTFDQAAVGIAHVRLNGYWLRVNQKLCDIVGYSEAEMLKLAFEDITHPEDKGMAREYVRELLAGERSHFSLEKRYIRKDGVIIWVNLTVSLVRDPSGAPKYYIAVTEDITRRKETEAQLLHLANHDSLTGLANRTLLHDRLAQVIAMASRSGHSVAVLLLDLDRFKNVNDSLGHNIGDQFIREVADRLRDCACAGDTVARTGGDEFVLVLGEIDRAESAVVVARKALEVISRPLVVGGQELKLSGSIGISIYPRDGLDSHSLLKNADTAMYRAKDAGKNTFQFYAAEMNAHAFASLTLENNLRYALERTEFLLHYQPQVDAFSGEIIGFEALLRWQSHNDGLIPPSRFLQLAEETSLILPIGEWVLRTACSQARAWVEMGGAPLRMAVNLSALQFKQQDVAGMVARVLRETGCKPGCLELEITESMIMSDVGKAIQTMHALKAMGMSLSIDDFGTGYSSLNYLKRFPIDTLKIDQSFIRDITTDPDDELIAAAVIALAHNMRLKVIAEGVETEEQLAFLRHHGCDLVQGYYFSKPVPAQEVARLLHLPEPAA